MYRLRRVDDAAIPKALHAITFPLDEWARGDAYWVLYDDHKSPVGFCSLTLLKNESGIFLCRAGVLPHVSGKGIQRRMIRARLNYARSLGRKFATTYTTYDNHASIANLLRCGFKFYYPPTRYAGRSVHYFYKDI